MPLSLPPCPKSPSLHMFQNPEPGAKESGKKGKKKLQIEIDSFFCYLSGKGDMHYGVHSVPHKISLFVMFVASTLYCVY